jgi:hypothetical protein
MQFPWKDPTVGVSVWHCVGGIWLHSSGAHVLCVGTKCFWHWLVSIDKETHTSLGVPALSIVASTASSVALILLLVVLFVLLQPKLKSFHHSRWAQCCFEAGSKHPCGANFGLTGRLMGYQSVLVCVLGKQNRGPWHVLNSCMYLHCACCFKYITLILRETLQTRTLRLREVVSFIQGHILNRFNSKAISPSSVVHNVVPAAAASQNLLGMHISRPFSIPSGATAKVGVYSPAGDSDKCPCLWAIVLCFCFLT